MPRRLIFQAIRAAAGVEQDVHATEDATGGKNVNDKGVGDGNSGSGKAGGADAMEEEGGEDEEDAAETAVMPVRGPLPPQEGRWASCVRLLDPIEGATVECLELGE